MHTPTNSRLQVSRRLTVELEHDGPFLTATAYYRGVPAGRAVFTIEQAGAELSDVVVYERAYHWWPPARALGLKRSYRRVGVGTSMMNAALQYLRGIGVREVEGILGGGDLEVQRAWYGQLGFDVTSTDRVSIHL